MPSSLLPSYVLARRHDAIRQSRAHHPTVVSPLALSGARETLHWSPVVATDTACGKGIMIQQQACAGLSTHPSTPSQVRGVDSSVDQPPNRRAERAFALAASSFRSFGLAVVSSEASNRSEILPISSTAE